MCVAIGLALWRKHGEVHKESSLLNAKIGVFH
jgi:hypothetical protein